MKLVPFLLVNAHRALQDNHLSTIIKKRSPAKALPSKLLVRRSATHGRGLFARNDFAAGEQVAEYTGKMYAEGEVSESWDGCRTYLFALSDGSTIDGADGGNESRYLNHSCDPNVEAFEIRQGNGIISLMVSTLRCVRAGEELLLDYSLVIDESDDVANYSCLCGHECCRGSMAALAAGLRKVS